MNKKDKYDYFLPDELQPAKNEADFLYKIDNDVELTESEAKYLVNHYEIERIYGENDRWTRPVTSIVNLKDRYFSVEWYQGLTEIQTSDGYELIEEVKCHEYQKTITVKEWVSVKEEEMDRD